MPATVHHLPIRPRQTLANLCEPSREQDEALLRVIAAYEAEGGQVLFSGESSEEGDASQEGDRRQPGADQCPTDGKHSLAVTSPAPYVSPYLQQPLRTEDEVRALRNQPRIPQAKGLAQLIAEQTGLDRTFAKLFGG